MEESSLDDSHLIELGTRTVSATAKVEDCDSDDVVGLIKILHASVDDITKSGTIVLPSKTQPEQKYFPNLQKRFNVLKTNSIIHIEASGNCFCWEFYDGKHYKGKKQLIWPGDRTKLEGKPGSLKKVRCPEDYESYDYY